MRHLPGCIAMRTTSEMATDSSEPVAVLVSLDQHHCAAVHSIVDQNFCDATVEEVSHKAARTILSLDTLGIAASSLCLVHCLAMPFLIAALPFLGLQFLEGNFAHRLLAGFRHRFCPFCSFAWIFETSSQGSSRRHVHRAWSGSYRHFWCAPRTVGVAADFDWQFDSGRHAFTQSWIAEVRSRSLSEHKQLWITAPAAPHHAQALEMPDPTDRDRARSTRFRRRRHFRSYARHRLI